MGNASRMPVVFSGHGSPMVALEDNEITRGQEVARSTGAKNYDELDQFVAQVL